MDVNLFLFIIILIVLIYIINYRKNSKELFQNIRVINMYNEYNLGDCIFTLIYLYNIKQYLINNNIIINFYIDKSNIYQVNDFNSIPNVKIHDISLKPEDSLNTWLSINEDKTIPLNEWLSIKFSQIGRELHLPEITNFTYIDTSLIERYDKLNDIYKNIDILIINSVSRSGAYDINKKKGEWDNMIKTLSNNYKIVTTEKVDDILCTKDQNLLIKDIAAISTHVNYIIAVNTGPIVGCFNDYTFNNVKTWYLYETQRPESNYYSYKKFKFNIPFYEILQNLNSL